MNRRLPVVAVVLLVAGAGAWWASRDRSGNSTELVLHGNVDIRQVQLAFDASGRIEQVLAQEGDRVQKGQPLARLDTTRLKLALDQARALAAAQRSQLAKLEAGSRPEEVRQAAAQRDATAVEAREATQQYERQRDLVAKRFVSPQQLDSAKNALDAARNRLQAAEQAYRLAVLGPRREDIAAARASLAAQEAIVATLEHDIAQGELRAPAAGIIESRVLEPGDMASPQSTVFTLALTDPVWGRVYLPESALGRIPVGARAFLSTDSHPDRRYAGWIGYVAPVAEFTPKSVETPDLRTSLVYQARVFACEGQDVLRQGMPVTVTIAFDQAPSAGRPCPGSR